MKKRSKDGSMCGAAATFSIGEKKSKHFYCKKHLYKSAHPILKPIINQSANKIPIQLIQKNLIKKLNKMTCFMEVDHCVIENQPSFKNPRMKSIASTLYDYFLITFLMVVRHFDFLLKFPKVEKTNGPIEQSLAITNILIELIINN